MKTAISLPNRLFDEAEKTAKKLGIPRSQLFARALEEFIDRHKRDKITERLNLVYRAADEHIAENTARIHLESMRKLTENDAW